MEGGINRPGECSDTEESFVLGKKIKKEIINLTEENVSVSHGIEGDRVRTEDIQEHEVGRTLRHVENGSVNTSTEAVELTENNGNHTIPEIKEETVADNSLIIGCKTTENSSEESERKLLREDIQEWLVRYEHISDESLATCLKDLQDIRQKRDRVCQLWQSEVLYIRELQKQLKWVADKLATADQKKELVNLLKRILHPWDVLQEKYFPDIREILGSMLDKEATRKEPFPIRNRLVLRKVLDEEQWTLKREVREMIQKEQHIMKMK